MFPKSTISNNGNEVQHASSYYVQQYYQWPRLHFDCHNE